MGTVLPFCLFRRWRGRLASHVGKRQKGNTVPVPQVNTYTTSEQRFPSIGVRPNGALVVVWHDKPSFLVGDVYGQRYDASGNAVGTEFQINTYVPGWQSYPRVGVDADGDFVVVWQSEGSAGDDTSSWSVQGQRYSGALPTLPSLGPAGLIGLALLLSGSAGAALRRRLRGRA